MEESFVQTDKKFWEHGIMKLFEKWQKVEKLKFLKVISVSFIFLKNWKKFLANPLISGSFQERIFERIFSWIW